MSKTVREAKHEFRRFNREFIDKFNETYQCSGDRSHGSEYTKEGIALRLRNHLDQITGNLRRELREVNHEIVKKYTVEREQIFARYNIKETDLLSYPHDLFS